MDQCTLYLTLAGAADFLPLLEEYFSGWAITEDASTASFTVSKRKLFSKQRIVFSLKSKEKDGDAFNSMQAGMYNFFAAVQTEHGRVKDSVLAQIQVFTVVAGVVADKDMDDDTFGRVMLIAGDGNGLVFLPPGDLYDVKGNLVFNLDGDSDLTAHTVHAPAELLDRRVAVTESGERRKERTNNMLSGQGIPVAATLPLIVGDEDYVPRSREEVVARTLAILLTSVYAELLPKEGPSARDLVAKLLEQYSAGGFLSPDERAFLNDPEPSDQDITNFTWRYECAWVGMWTLGFVEELSYPDGICDVAAMAGMIREFGDLAAITERAALREPGEILDEADLIYRCDWACVDARIKGEDAPADLNPGVVMERHRMLNWLVRYMDAGWDDVTMDT